MTPDGGGYFRLVYFDGAGHDLTGFGAQSISATPAGALDLRQDSDSFNLFAPPNVGTIIDLIAGTLHQTIEIVDPTSVASIDLARPYVPAGADAETPVPTEATLEYALGDLFDIVAYEADGRYVYGPCPDFAFAAPGSSDVVSLDTPPVGNRGFIVKYAKPGTATFTVTCFGKTTTHTVTIKPPKP